MIQNILLQTYVILLAFLIFSLPFGNEIQAQDLKTVRLQLKWYHQFQFAGYYAAQQQGYYKDAGIDVELLEGNPDNPPVDNVLSGIADFGVTGSDIMNLHVAKKPVVVISSIFQHSPYVFLTLADKKINSLTDLVGKKVMVSEDQGWLLLRALFLREGIDINTIEILPHSWNNEDLIDGTVDALSAYSTVEPEQFRRMGYNVHQIRPVEYGIDFYGDVLFTSRRIADKHPELVEEFNEASLKGWEYALSHPAEIIAYILTLPGVKERGVTAEELLFEATEMKKMILPDLVEVGHMNAGRWQNMLDIYKELGLAESSDSLDGFLFQSPGERKIIYFDNLLYALGVGVSLFIIALLWNWQLRKIVQRRTLDLQKEIMTRKDAEQRLELAIKATGLGIWEWNLKTNESSYGQKWIQTLGYDPDEFSRKSRWIDIVHPEDLDYVKEALKDLIRGQGEAKNIAYRVRTSDGEWKWVLSFSKALNIREDGRADHIIGTHLDIDFIKSKEIELQDITRKLRKTNEELEKFAYITSHNLRTPVVNLISLTEMQFEEDLTKDLAQEIKEKIRYCVSQLDITLNDLAEVVMSKSDSPIAIEKLNIREELERVIRSIGKQVEESGVQISTDLDEADFVYFPRNSFHSVLLNLLTNAIKYKSDERELRVNLKTKVRNGYTVLYFSDNGLGMDMTRFGNKIFGLFQRFHKKIDGKGLGLYIIKSQIESMDGKIEVNSTPDVGTTFKLSFRNKPAAHDSNALS